MTDIYGGNTDSIFTEGIRTLVIEDTDQTNDNVKIDLSSTLGGTINLIAPNVLVNGAPIGGGIQNPLTSNLNIATYDVVNNTGLSLTGINSKTRHITADNDFTIVGSILQAPIMRTDTIADYIGDVSAIDLLQTGIQIFVDKPNPMFDFNGKGIVYTPYPNQIQSDGFKKTGAIIGGGEYLMADGTSLKFSQNSGNSNFYLYNNLSGASPPPSNFNGNVSYNNSAQASATVIYITHLTRDNIDVEIFYAQISSINDLYIQDQENSVNFIKYNITASTYIANQYITLSVIAISAGGTGFTNFGNGHNIIISFFQNSPEISQRLSQLENKTTNIASITAGVNTQFQGNITADGLSTSGALSTGALTTGSIVLNGLANMDVENWSRPFIGIQFVHNSATIATLSNSPWTVLGNNFVVSPFAITNNASRQLCCAISTPSGSADGTTTGAVSTSLTGARVMTQYSFGLIASFNIADTGTFQPNNCQNFIGLWNVAPAIILNQATQLSVQRNMICFGSNTTDANLCIYTAGALNTVRQVNLGVYFPANRPALTVSTDWYKLSLYWDGTVVYYRAINTLYPNIPAANLSGSFTPLASDMPPTSTAMHPQILRIMGTPNGATQGKLQIQRFGIIL